MEINDDIASSALLQAVRVSEQAVDRKIERQNADDRKQGDHNKNKTQALRWV